MAQLQVEGTILEHKKRTYQVFVANIQAPIPEDAEVRHWLLSGSELNALPEPEN